MKTMMKKKPIESMTKEEARIAICKDVIRHLRSLRVKSSNGYIVDMGCDLPTGTKLPPATDDAQKHVGKIVKRCEVCALGGMMFSFIRLFDDVPMKKMMHWDAINCGREYIASKLHRYFTPDQLYQIERAFEHGNGLKDKFNSYGYDGEEENDKNRLRAIMLNVVRNGGKFVPYVPPGEGAFA